jgi:hypothetical protein
VQSFSRSATSLVFRIQHHQSLKTDETETPLPVTPPRAQVELGACEQPLDRPDK